MERRWYLALAGAALAGGLTDSRWRRSTGNAVDGSHEGSRLARVSDVSPQFWFAWLEFDPDTELYGG